MTPLMKPTAAPTTSTASTARRPRSLPLAPLRTNIDRMTADSVSPPSTDRSIDPIRIMNVAPMPRTSGIMAERPIRTKLPKVRKLGLMKVIMMHRSTSTRTGAHDAARQRRARGIFRLSGWVAGLLRMFTMADWARLIVCAGKRTDAKPHGRSSTLRPDGRDGVRRAPCGARPRRHFVSIESVRWRGPRCPSSRSAVPP